jgi:hypothetical protein
VSELRPTFQQAMGSTWMPTNDFGFQYGIEFTDFHGVAVDRDWGVHFLVRLFLFLHGQSGTIGMMGLG